MMGRPPVTRARVLRYWERNGPCPVRQIARDLGMDRSNVKRILRRFAEMQPVLRTRMR
jgi:DNA-binding MarR family transcriptional regulator